MQNRQQNRNQSSLGREAGRHQNEDGAGAQWGADTDWENNRGHQGRPDEQQAQGRSSNQTEENRNAGSWRGGYSQRDEGEQSFGPQYSEAQRSDRGQAFRGGMGSSRVMSDQNDGEQQYGNGRQGLTGGGQGGQSYGAGQRGLAPERGQGGFGGSSGQSFGNQGRDLGYGSQGYGSGQGYRLSGGNQSMQSRGKGPKGYTRSDERIMEDVCDRLASEVDASEVEVVVLKGEVTLTGTIADRHLKFQIEHLADQVMGVTEVHNQLRVKREGTRDQHGGSPSSMATGTLGGGSMSGRSEGDHGSSVGGSSQLPDDKNRKPGVGGAKS